MPDDPSFVDNELRITCADAVELVTEYLDDALSAADLDDFTTHLDLCEGCRVYLDQIRRTIRIVAAGRAHDVPVAPADMDRLEAELARRADDDAPPGGL